MNNNEIKRRERISASLKEYFNSDRGLAHRKKISCSQKLKMSRYYEFLNNNEMKINITDEK